MPRTPAIRCRSQRGPVLSVQTYCVPWQWNQKFYIACAARMLYDAAGIGDTSRRYVLRGFLFAKFPYEAARPVYGAVGGELEVKSVPG